MRIEKARYSPSILPEHRGNPLIEALPVKLPDEDLIDELRFYPECSHEERGKDAFERVEYLSRLKDLRQPQLVHLDVFRAVERALKEGYSAKNPHSPTTMNYLHYSLDERPEIEPRTGFFKPKGSGITVIGESGVGKTCMLDQVLGYFPDVIVHEKSSVGLLPLRQVVWLKVDCPGDSTIKGLCLRILEELDRKLGLEPTTPRSTIALLVSQIEAKIKASFLGILVIDEMQNLNLAKAGGAERLLGFLHNLVNNLGIPLLFCANPPFDELLSKSLKSARRAESGGYFDVNLLGQRNGEWELFVEELWELQWTNVVTPLTEALSNKLYELSVGNMDLAVRTFREAQQVIIGSLDERLTEEVLEKGASIAIRASKSARDELAHDQKLNLLKRKKKVKAEHPGETKANPSKKAAVAVNKGKLVQIPGDLSRPHHPEFADILTTLQHTDDLYEQIPDPDLIQRASEEDDPLGPLREAGVLCEDPLKAFA
ncbi:ATP-binding protein [Ferrimonas balearica]|uniref:ATP-binding protein n=1 Tax=Ferrimonas balearica TaxID=44012 RepID=UPI001C5B4886|nr:ATP-binding protein [Ferrimonas balearica]MBW3166484.1 ATP-binding protein [Ferrimonas balearica]